MKVESQNIEIKKKARFYTNDPDLSKIENIWFLLHGYGQLAGSFINKFTLLDNGKNLLVSPEALSRFYLDNGFGKMGASWMTREERDNEIEDYVDYLTSLYQLMKEKINKPIVKLNVFAFSQGTSTACRWLQRSGIKADNLILWGSFFPPDFDLGKADNSFNKIMLVTGTEDQFFSPSALEEGKKLLKEYGVSYKVHIFDGEHEMKEKIINEVLCLI
jgi:predicted esterase